MFSVSLQAVYSTTHKCWTQQITSSQGRTAGASIYHVFRLSVFLIRSLELFALWKSLWLECKNCLSKVISFFFLPKMKDHRRLCERLVATKFLQDRIWVYISHSWNLNMTKIKETTSHINSDNLGMTAVYLWGYASGINVCLTPSSIHVLTSVFLGGPDQCVIRCRVVK